MIKGIAVSAITASFCLVASTCIFAQSTEQTSAISSINTAPVDTIPLRISAGKDQTVLVGGNIKLTASVIGAAEMLRYQWSQISGDKMLPANANSAVINFIAPETRKASSALFKVSATDKNGKAYTDSAVVIVVPRNSIKRYEAEADQGVILSSVKKATNIPGFSGTGYITGYNGSDADATTWTINFEAAGFYKIEVGYQTIDDKEFLLFIDGVQYVGKMPSRDKGFNVASVGTQLISAGNHEFVVKGGWSFYNLDFIQFTPAANPALPQSVNAEPVNRNATPQTKALYRYMTGLYGQKTLSGQQDANEMNTVLERSGKLPAIYSLDVNSYNSLAVSQLGKPKSGTEDFIRAVNTNKLIASLIWHWHSPRQAKQVTGCNTRPCWWSSFYTTDTNFNLKEALADPNGANYKALIKDMDLIAIQLKKLETAGIPVLWRPLHESEGGWFWWGASGKESFVSLWRIMYDRFTRHHQLNNLIWVLTIGDPDWYPGDDVVDFVGVDAYPKDKHDNLGGIWSTMFERFDGHKMLVLSEYGGVPFVNEMQDNGIWWGYFASWNDKDARDPLGPKKMTPEELKKIYNLPGVITADELTIPKTQ